MERLGCTTQIRDGGLPSRRREFIHSLFEPLRRMTTTSPVIEREPGSFDRRLNDRRRALSRLLRSAGYCLLELGIHTPNGRDSIRGPIEVYFIWGRQRGLKEQHCLYRMKRTRARFDTRERNKKKKKERGREKLESSYSKMRLASVQVGDRKIRSNK